jgi:type I restriction enzyme S subunit
MSSEWPLKELVLIADEVTVGYVGPMATEYVESGIPFLRSLNINQFNINNNDLKYVTPKFHQRIKKSSLHPGDVAIVRTGKPGTCAVIPDWLQEANCSDLVIVRCGREIRPHFLCYWVNSKATHHIESHTVGAVQQHFNVGAAKTMKVAVPSLHEQDQILELLRGLDDRITLLRETNTTLEAIAQALFKSWFVDFDPVRAKQEGREPEGMAADTAALFPDCFEESELGLVPKGWRVGVFGDIADAVRKQISPTELHSGLHYLGLENMPRQSLSLTEWGDAQGLESAKAAFSEGDILFGKLRPYFHKVVIAPFDGVCSTDILVCCPKKAAYYGLVAMHLYSVRLVEYASRLSNGAKMPRINWKDIAAYSICIPPSTIADDYSNTVSSLFARMKANVHKAQTLATLRDTLLPRLISGQLRLPDAEALLDESNINKGSLVP